jgi:hypothetical protein
MSHTPTPWVAIPSTLRMHKFEKPVFDNGIVHILPESNQCRLPICSIDRGDDHDAPTRERAIVDAEFIVRAVNCHEELLAALKKARGRILANRIAEAGRLGMSYGEALKMFDDGIDPHLVNIDAAIALAEGTK